jgi:hypothetical protein
MNAVVSDKLSNEDVLLLRCATTTISPAVRQDIAELVNQTLDWPYFYRRAFDHKLTPLAYRTLARLCPDKVPAPILKQMRTYCETNQRYAFMLSIELLRILKLLREEQISAIPFKGPVLAQSAYEDLAARYYVDLDLLVQEADVNAARGLLENMGYVTTQDRGEEGVARRLDYSYTLLNPMNKIQVELHWRIAPTYLSFPFDNALLWKRKTLLTLLDMAVDVFSAEDTFLILCMHGSKHYWHRSSWLTDVTELSAKQPTLDWSYITQRAKHLHIYRMLLLTIRLMHELQNAAVPNDLLVEALSSATVKDLVYWVKRWMFNDKIIPVGYFAGYAFQFKIREYWWDKLLYIRIKQPMIHENNAPVDALRIPRHDRGLYFFLLGLRLIKHGLVNPMKRLLNRHP